jgi:hypothetical protein
MISIKSNVSVNQTSQTEESNIETRKEISNENKEKKTISCCIENSKPINGTQSFFWGNFSSPFSSVQTSKEKRVHEIHTGQKKRFFTNCKTNGCKREARYDARIPKASPVGTSCVVHRKRKMICIETPRCDYENNCSYAGEYIAFSTEKLFQSTPDSKKESLKVKDDLCKRYCSKHKSLLPYKQLSLVILFAFTKNAKILLVTLYWEKKRVGELIK